MYVIFRNTTEINNPPLRDNEKKNKLLYIPERNQILEKPSRLLQLAEKVFQGL